MWSEHTEIINVKTALLSLKPLIIAIGYFEESQKVKLFITTLQSNFTAQLNIIQNRTRLDYQRYLGVLQHFQLNKIQVLTPWYRNFTSSSGSLCKLKLVSSNICWLNKTLKIKTFIKTRALLLQPRRKRTTGLPAASHAPLLHLVLQNHFSPKSELQIPSKVGGKATENKVGSEHTSSSRERWRCRVIQWKYRPRIPDKQQNKMECKAVSAFLQCKSAYICLKMEQGKQHVSRDR